MLRLFVGLAFAAVITLGGCAKPPSPEEIAKLKGGRTKVVVFGFCIPFDHLIKTTITRHKLTFFLNDKPVGQMNSCSTATFDVPSGYWRGHFQTTYTALDGLYPHGVMPAKYHPGTTKYLHMRPVGNQMFRGFWVDKAKADKGIARIKQISQMF